MRFILRGAVSRPGVFFKALYSILEVLKRPPKTNNSFRLTYIQLNITFIILYLFKLDF
jgi:hypothetical protein